MPQDGESVILPLCASQNRGHDVSEGAFYRGERFAPARFCGHGTGPLSTRQIANCANFCPVAASTPNQAGLFRSSRFWWLVNRSIGTWVKVSCW